MKLSRKLILVSLVFTNLAIINNLVAKEYTDPDSQEYEEDTVVDTDKTQEKPTGLKALPHNYKEVLDLLSSSKDRATTTWSGLKDTYHSLKDKWQSLKKLVGWPSTNPKTGTDSQNN